MAGACQGCGAAKAPSFRTAFLRSNEHFACLQARSQQAVELAQEVAAITARVQEATTREQHQAGLLEEERCARAIEQQQCAAEAKAADVQIAKLQGLLEVAQMQLHAGQVGAFALHLQLVICTLPLCCATRQFLLNQNAGGSSTEHQHAGYKCGRHPVWFRMHIQSPGHACRSPMLGPRLQNGCSSAPART